MSKHKKKRQASVKPPGEIKLHDINCGENCRQYLKWCYTGSLDDPSFEGTITQISKNKILFQRLNIEFTETSGDVIAGKEDHVWIYGSKPFLDSKVKVGDCVSFSAEVYAYRRKDKSVDFALKNCCDIRKISGYELPDDNELAKQALNRIICETCLYNRHCNGFCLMI